MTAWVSSVVEEEELEDDTSALRRLKRPAPSDSGDEDDSVTAVTHAQPLRRLKKPRTSAFDDDNDDDDPTMCPHEGVERSIEDPPQSAAIRSKDLSNGSTAAMSDSINNVTQPNGKLMKSHVIGPQEVLKSKKEVLHVSSEVSVVKKTIRSRPASPINDDHEGSDTEQEMDYLKFREVTAQIKQKVSEALGGPNNVEDISSKISRGRCSFTRTYNPPPAILAQNPNLKPYQVAAVHWLLTLFENRLNGLVADDMGLGKSAECICFLKRLYIDKLLRLPTVIACPTTLLENWNNELAKWAPELRVLKYHGTQNERRRLMRKWETGLDEEEEFDEEEEEAEEDDTAPAEDTVQPCDVTEDSENRNRNGETMDEVKKLDVDPESGCAYHVLITTHGILSNTSFDRHLFFKCHNFGYMVVDEAHTLKNSASQRYQQMNKSINAPNRLLLTGSPVQNQISELRNLLTFLNPYRHASFDLDRALQYHCKIWRKAVQQGKKVGRTKASDTENKKATSAKTSPIKQEKSVDKQGTTDAEESHESRSAPSTVMRQETSPPSSERVSDSKHTDELTADTSIEELKKSSDALMDDGETSAAPTSSSMQGESNLSSPRESEGSSSALDSIMNPSPTMVKEATGGDDGPNGATTDPEILFYQQLLAPLILRRLKAEVIDNFPRKTNKIEFCEMTPLQRQLYDQEMQAARPLLNDVNTLFKRKRRGNRSSKKDSSIIGMEGKRALDSSLDASGAGAVSLSASETPQSFIKGLLFRLRRICNHPLLSQRYFDSEKRKEFASLLKKNVNDYRIFPLERVIQHIADWSDFDIYVGAKEFGSESFAIPSEEFLTSCKILRMLELVDDLVAKKQRVLIFSQFTTFLDVMQETFFLHRPHLAILRLDGKTAVDDRSVMVSAFQSDDSDYSVFLLSTKAGGVGLNLTKANTVLLMDQDWNPHNDRQAEDRVHRLGQTEDVTVYRLCCRHSFEEAILSCCKKKLELDEAFGGTTESLPLEIFENMISSVQSYQPLAQIQENKSKDEKSNLVKEVEEEEEGSGKRGGQGASAEAEQAGEKSANTTARTRGRKRPDTKGESGGKTPLVTPSKHSAKEKEQLETTGTTARTARSRKGVAAAKVKAKGKVESNTSSRAQRRSLLLPGGDSDDE